MIGAMPAVAVRHERHRQENRTGAHSKRPSQLYINGFSISHLSHSACSTSTSPAAYHDLDPFPEYYICGKISSLQVIISSLLLGTIILIVGLVQLTPGADAEQYRFVLIECGVGFIVLGLLIACYRCYYVGCCGHCPHQHHQVTSSTDEVPCIGVLVKNTSNTTAVLTHSSSLMDSLARNHPQCVRCNQQHTLQKQLSSQNQSKQSLASKQPSIDRTESCTSTNEQPNERLGSVSEAVDGECP